MMSDTWSVLQVTATGVSVEEIADFNFEILHLGINAFALMPTGPFETLSSEIDAQGTEQPARSLSFRPLG